MYNHDPEKKFRYMLVGASSLFLGILMFGEERERDIMFHSMISLIKGDIDRDYSIDYQGTTLQEAFLLYDIYTGGKNHDLWTPYITKPLTPLYQDCMDNILLTMRRRSRLCCRTCWNTMSNNPTTTTS